MENYLFEHGSNPSLRKAAKQQGNQPTSQSTYQPPIQCRYNNKPPRLSVFLYFPLGFSPHSGNRGQVQLSIYIYTRRRFYNAAGAAGVYPIPWLASRAPPLFPPAGRVHLDFHEFRAETRRPTTPPPLTPARGVACQPTFIFAPVFDPFHPFDPRERAELLQLREPVWRNRIPLPAKVNRDGTWFPTFRDLIFFFLFFLRRGFNLGKVSFREVSRFLIKASF